MGGGRTGGFQRVYANAVVPTRRLNIVFLYSKTKGFCL